MRALDRLSQVVLAALRDIVGFSELGSTRVLPKVQVLSVGETRVFAEVPVGSVVEPHLCAGLVQGFPEETK